MAVEPLIEPVASTAQFVERWLQPPNFRISPELFQPDFEFPSALEVLDRLRKDDATKVTFLGDEEAATRTVRAMTFRRASLDEIAAWPFRLVHFELSRFYDDFLSGFQESVMIPWRVFLTELGFTWQRCYPILFMSTGGCSSTYHVDNSHGLVWQVHGVKNFHSFLEPERYAPVESAVLGRIAGESSPAHDEKDRLSLRMSPGDLVWSHALTPHWVVADSPVTLSLNISHGGLARAGRFSERDSALRRHWDDHPGQAWLSGLRNAHY
ncbi:hypothetical protein ACIGW7_10805 [Streptomyces sp. NPDC053253]|uniref:hypothetical protein n=1 Tax=Streptomyces sp. NPDC053253 TaxID=3365699 RepID=UPI0037D70FAA